MIVNSRALRRNGWPTYTVSPLSSAVPRFADNIQRLAGVIEQEVDIISGAVTHLLTTNGIAIGGSSRVQREIRRQDIKQLANQALLRQKANVQGATLTVIRLRCGGVFAPCRMLIAQQVRVPSSGVSNSIHSSA